MVAAAGVSDLPRHRAYAFLWSVRVPDREISLIFNASRIFWRWQEGGENIFICLQFVKTCFILSANNASSRLNRAAAARRDLF